MQCDIPTVPQIFFQSHGFHVVVNHAESGTSLPAWSTQDATRRHAVEIIMCMITRDFRVILINVTSLSLYCYS